MAAAVQPTEAEDAAVPQHAAAGPPGGQAAWERTVKGEEVAEERPGEQGREAGPPDGECASHSSHDGDADEEGDEGDEVDDEGTEAGVLDLEAHFRSIDRMSFAELLEWYRGAGLPGDKALTRDELAGLLRKVTQWEMQPLSLLRRECAMLLGCGETEEAVKKEPRGQLVYRLMLQDRVEAWESRGYPVRRVDKPATAVQVVTQYIHIDRMSSEELRDWYKSAGFPLVKDLRREEITQLLKRVTLWHALPLTELQLECEATGAKVPAADDGDLTTEEQRSRLVDLLVVQDRMAAWSAAGFEAMRMGSVDVAISAVEQYDSFLRMPEEELKQVYAKAGLPEPSATPREDVLKALKRVLVWELLPAAALEEDCRTRSLPCAVEGATGEEARHAELLQRLKMDMSVSMNRGHYERKGIPVAHMRNLEAAHVAAQLDHIEDMGLDELLKWYRGTGLPDEKGLEREELVGLLKKVTIWSALPMEGLLEECTKHKVSQEAMQKAVKASELEAQWSQLLYQLLVNERLPAWEAQGFPMSRIGNADIIVQAVARYVDFQKMGDQELQKTCKEAGLTKAVQTMMTREGILQTLKAVLVWELLPLTELRQECAARGLPCLNGRTGEREESIRWLVAATFCNTWADRGVPAERLGCLEVTAAVVDQVDRLRTLVLYSDMLDSAPAALQAEYKKLAVPFDPALEPAELVDRLRDVLVWKGLPMQELIRECQDSGVSTAADPSKVIAFMTETTKRSELLKRLVLRKWEARSWAPRGIPAEKIGSLETLEALITKLDRVRSLSSPQLHAEFQKMGVHFDATWDTEVLRGKLRDLLVWDHLPMEELHRECTSRGVAVQDAWAEYRSGATGDAGARKPGTLGMGLLAGGAPLGGKAWPGAGVAPAVKPEAKSLDSKLSGSFKDPFRPGALGSRLSGGLNNLRPGAGGGPPKAASGALGRPFNLDSGASRKLGGLGLWKARTPDIARPFAKAPGGPPANLGGDAATGKGGGDAAARRLMVGRLFENTRLREWEAQGVPVLRLGDAKKAIQLLEPIDQMSLRELAAWYKTAGFPEESGLDRGAMARLAKMVTVWEALPLRELQKECEQKGLPGEVEFEEVEGSDEGRRWQLVEQLLADEQMRRWEAEGFQAQRVGDVSQVMQAVEQYERFVRMGAEELRKTYADAGLPEGASREDMLGTLKTVLLWELMPMEELEKDCARRGLPTELAGNGGSEEDRRFELASRLRVDLSVSMSRESYERKGIPVDRLGTLMASRVASQFKHIERCDEEELKEWYKSTGFPAERALTTAHIVDLWKKVTVWGALRPAELRAECERRQVSLSTIIQSGDIERQREHLVYQLLAKEKMEVWEAKGYQSSRMGSLDTACQVVAQLEHFEGLSDEDLRQVYSECGLPERKGAGRTEWMEVLRVVLIWELLPVSELEKDCAERGVPTQTDDGEGQRHGHLLQRLKLDLQVSLCKELYEAKGVPVDRLGALQVLHVAAQFDSFQAMTAEELKAACVGAGLPDDSDMDRELMLDSLRRMAVWESLPLRELQRDCMERGLPIQVSGSCRSDAEREAELLHRLVIDLCVDLQRASYEQQGIPVRRLGTLRAHGVAATVERLSNMPLPKLKEAHAEAGLPVEDGVTRELLLRRLREITVWEALPMAELREECTARGVLEVGGHRAGARGEEEREHLLDALKLQLYAHVFEALRLPMQQIRTFRAAAGVAREWARLDAMHETEVRARYVDLGVSPQFLKVEEMRERLKKVAFWLEIPFRDLQSQCVTNHVNSYGKEGERYGLIRRLAAALWPARPNPNPPPQPPPFYQEPHSRFRPPPRQPPPIFAQAAQGKMDGYFRALELETDAVFEDVKKAYRRLALKYHPDKNQGPSQDYAARTFRTVAEAYEKLSEHFKIKGR